MRWGLGLAGALAALLTCARPATPAWAQCLSRRPDSDLSRAQAVADAAGGKGGLDHQPLDEWGCRSLTVSIEAGTRTETLEVIVDGGIVEDPTTHQRRWVAERRVQFERAISEGSVIERNDHDLDGVFEQQTRHSFVDGGYLGSETVISSPQGAPLTREVRTEAGDDTTHVVRQRWVDGGWREEDAFDTSRHHPPHHEIR